MPLTSRITVAALAISIAGLWSCTEYRGNVADQALARPSVCMIRSDPKSFDERRVTVTGKVSSDGLHLISLTDSACDGKGIALEFDEALANDSKLRKMKQVIFSGTPGTIGKDIEGTFSGMFSWRRGERIPFVLAVSRVEELRIGTITPQSP